MPSDHYEIPTWQIGEDGAISERSLGYLQFVERRGGTVYASFGDSTEGREWVPRVVFSDRDSGAVNFLDAIGNVQCTRFHVVRESDSSSPIIAELASEVRQRMKDDPWFAAMVEVKLKTLIANLEDEASDLERDVMPSVSEGTEAVTLKFRRR
jgi:hypothetical protein